MAVVVAHLPIYYVLSRQASLGIIKKADAIRTISSRTQIPLSSASDIVRDYNHLIKGEPYHRRLASSITEYFLDSILRDDGIEQLSVSLISLWGHIEYYERVSQKNSFKDREIYTRFSERITFAGVQLLSAEILNKVTPEYIWIAIQKILLGEKHSFSESTKFDVLIDRERRLPPKAVFGVALSLALDREIFPGHFSAGESSICFRLLREAGYEIVLKNKVSQTERFEAGEKQEWEEGEKKLVLHLRRERATGLSQAKKAQYKRMYGVLSCQRCGIVPMKYYMSEHAEACIEVHHNQTKVSEMEENHKTRLEDLLCLCANCHRLIHKELAAEKMSEKAALKKH